MPVSDEEEDDDEEVEVESEFQDFDYTDPDLFLHIDKIPDHIVYESSPVCDYPRCTKSFRFYCRVCFRCFCIKHAPIHVIKEGQTMDDLREQLKCLICKLPGYKEPIFETRVRMYKDLCVRRAVWLQ